MIGVWKWLMVLVLVTVGTSKHHGKRVKRLAVMHLESRRLSFEDAILEETNKYRAKNGAGPLTWDSDLQTAATEWAEHLATEDKFYHSDAVNKGMGENLYYAKGWPEKKMPGLAVKKWYEEMDNYNFSKPGFGHNTGHFTQLVWKDTKKVGCGMATSSSNKMYVCCNYSPPGNYPGEFPKNVLPPQ